jgi:hypothetical protein
MLVGRTRRRDALTVAVDVIARAIGYAAPVAVAMLVGRTRRRDALAVAVDVIARAIGYAAPVAVAVLVARTRRDALTVAVDVIARASAIAIRRALKPRRTADWNTAVADEYFIPAAWDGWPAAFAANIRKAIRAVRIDAIAITPDRRFRTERCNEAGAAN